MSVQVAGRLRHHPAYHYTVRGLVVVAVLLLAFQIAHLWQGYTYGSPGTDDFIEYWSAGQLFLIRKNPYDFDELHKLQTSLGSKYKSPIIMWNPPWLLVWIVPLLLLPFEVAALVWLAENVGLILLCGTILWRTLAPASTRDHVGTAWVATVLFVPALFTVRMGQMSTLLLVGATGFLYWMEKEKPFLAGMFLALTTIKPHVLYLLWIAIAYWVITRRKWQLMAGISVTMAISLAALTAIWPTWLSAYRQAIAQPPLYWASPTAGTLLRLLVFRNWSGAQFLPPIVASLLFAGYLVAKRPSFDWRTATPSLLLVSVPTAAYGWTFDQIVLLVPYLQMVSGLLDDELRAKRRQKRIVVAGLLAIGAATMIENQLRLNDFFFFWVPWALGVVYAYVQAICRSTGEALSPRVAGVASMARRL